MSTEKTITAKAPDGALTMAELRRFLDEFDKATADAAGPAVDAVAGLAPKARVSFGGHIKSITVTVPG